MSKEPEKEKPWNNKNLPYEERRRLFHERVKEPIPDAPPRSRAVMVTVDPQTAENAKARPESIRIATRDESGATRLAGPQRRSVDAGPSSAVGWIQWGRSSYPGVWFTPDDAWDANVRHIYNPLDALKDDD
jgi:hypothetical protein